MKELNNNIWKLEREIELLHSSKTALLSKRKGRRISKEDYQFHKKLKEHEDKKREYSTEINQRLHDYKQQLRERREQQRFKEQNLVSLGFAGILVVLLGLMFMVNFSGLTGLVPYTPEDTLTLIINETFADSTTLTLNITNATSLRISGHLTGEGTVKVLLDIDGILFTVLDEDTTTAETSTNLITGFVIKEEEIISENITENTTEEVIEENISIEENITRETNITTPEVLNISKANVTTPEALNISKTNVTEEINLTINVTTNITENITIEENVTIEENITINATENITINVTPEMLNISEANITTPEALNISKANVTPTINVTENITINITPENITIEENITINITPEENITINVTPENITINITPIINVTTFDVLNISRANITINVTENITIEKSINVTPVEEKEEIDLIIEHNATGYIVEYETDAPELIEQKITEYKKIVTITAPLHYENVLAYTNITEVPRATIAVYWIRNRTKTLFKNITYIDTDNNGLIDKLQWVVPHLSNQSFEITITVLNVQSYPMVGAFWTVLLNTTGEADLEITPYDLTTFLPEPTDENRNMIGDDLEFYDFLCENESKKEEVFITTPFTCTNNKLEVDNTTYCYIQDNKTFVNYTELMQTNLSVNITSLYIYNYSCNYTSYLKDIVRTPGGHHILFEFGPSNATAHNWAVKNATSLTENATVSIRKPSGGAEIITGAYMYLDSTQADTEVWHNTTWKYNYTKDCSTEGDYEVYVELLSLGNSGAEANTTGIAEVMTYWVTDCIIAGAGHTNCTVHAKSKSTNATWKVFGGRLQLQNDTSNRSVCNITSVSGDANAYWTSDGQDTCTDPCGQWIEFYHNVSNSDQTDETTFTITCNDGTNNNTNMLLEINETCGPRTCGEATIAQGGYDDCADPTCTDNFTYIGNDTVESLGGFDLMTYDIGILDTWGWSTVSTYNITWDSDQSDCDCYVGTTACNSTSCYNNATNVIAFPDGGSNYGSNCCGDDSSEYYNITGYNATTLESTPTLTDACCNVSNSCVYSSTCYANSTSSVDVDADSDNDYCLEATWYDCGSDSDCGTGTTCNATNDCEDTLGPTITFVSPTPADDARQINNVIHVNVTVTDASNIDTCLLEWDNGTTTINYSMTKVGSGTSVTCNRSMITYDGVNYTYKVFANDTLNYMGNSTSQSNVENTKPPAPTHSTPADGAILTGNSQTITWTAGGSDAEGDTITYYWRIDTDNPPSPAYICDGSTTGTSSTACSTTDGTTYYWNIVANDGYENQTVTTAWNFTENSIPTIDSQSITPNPAYTTNDLTCLFTVSDAENTSIIVYYKWFNGTQTIISANKSVTSAVEDSVTLGSGNTAKGENWTCEIQPYDGFEYGTAQNVTRYINNSNPTITLTSPANNTPITTSGNRTPTFTWTSNDDDGDTLTHIIYISNESDMSPIINWSNVGTATTYTIGSELDLDTQYWWRVQVDEGTFKINSTDFNFTIESYEAISLITNSVDFGNMILRNESNTTDDSPPPLKIRNIGNIFANLTIQTLDALWDDPVAGLNTTYFRFKADNVTGEEGAFNYSASTTSWTNMSDSTITFIYDLDYNYSKDEAEIDLYIKVPADEPAGNKSSSISIST